MQCDKCRNESVFFQPYSGRYLCSRHLSRDIEARAKRSIRSHRWMRPGDHIAVVLTGDRKSAALLVFFRRLIDGRRDIRLSAALHGRDGGGDRESAETVARALGVPCIDLPPAGEIAPEGLAGVTRIARAVSLDDCARRVVELFLFGRAEDLVSPAPESLHGIPVICPFITIPSVEIDHYWELEGTGTVLLPEREKASPRSTGVGSLLEDYSRRHPATEFALLHLAGRLRRGGAAGAVNPAGSGPGTGMHTPSPVRKGPNS